MYGVGLTASESDQMVQLESCMPDDEGGGLLDVLFRVRTTLLRNALSLSSLSRRERSS
jgi:hypothetical protein